MYERFLDFCYFFSGFEHLIRDCADFELIKAEKGASVKINYGPWIRVAGDRQKVVDETAYPDQDGGVLESFGPVLAPEGDKYDQSIVGDAPNITGDNSKCIGKKVNSKGEECGSNVKFFGEKDN